MIRRFSRDGSEDDKPLHITQTFESLPADDQNAVRTSGVDPFETEQIIVSDILPTGEFGKNYVIRCRERIVVVADGAITTDIPAGDVAEIFNRDFVGNGVIELRMNDRRKIEIARYSRTLSDAVDEFIRDANLTLRNAEAGMETRDAGETAEKVSGLRESDTTYRCHTCGYPLAHQGDVCPKCTNKRGFIANIARYLKPHAGLIIVGTALSLVVTVANLGPGLLVRLLVDEAIMAEHLDAAEQFRMLAVIGGAFLGLIFVRMICQHFRIRIMGVLGSSVVRAMRIDAYRALQRLSLSYYDSELTGRIMARVLGDTQMVQGFIVNALQQAVINVLMIVGISVTLFSANATLALIALGPVPIVIFLGRFFSRRFKGVFRSVRRKYSSLSAAVAESVTGVRVVKSFAQEDREYDAFEVRNKDFYDASLTAVHTRSYFQPIVLFVMTIGTIVVWAYGGYQVIIGILTLGLLLQFITYMNQFYAPIQMLIQLTETYQQSATAAERVFNIMNMPSELSDHDEAVELANPGGRIELKEVSFGYNVGERVLRNVNLTIEPGEMVGVVGQTGSGKSTLISLVCRFYDPTTGTITIDGEDLRNVKTQSLRKNIGLVLQDTFLFARTIKENIAYGTDVTSDRDIVEAAKAANAHEFIMGFPDAYDNEVGERGITLSGGEKQRVSIARAILKNPAILILDEATSAVDSATEASIQEAMDRLVAGRTTIAIAHRLSTLRNADKLIVMDKGEIVETGTHEELMRAGGIYADLVQKQAGFARDIMGHTGADIIV